MKMHSMHVQNLWIKTEHYVMEKWNYQFVEINVDYGASHANHTAQYETYTVLSLTYLTISEPKYLLCYCGRLNQSTYIPKDYCTQP